MNFTEVCYVKSAAEANSTLAMSQFEFLSRIFARDILRSGLEKLIDSKFVLCSTNVVDYGHAIERNCGPLLVIVAGLYAMIGLTEGGSIERVSRSLYRKVLWALRPAEAAVRRLIIAAARGLVVKPQAARATGTAASGRNTSGKTKTKSKSQGRSLFRLFDPPRRISPFIGRRGRRRRGPEPRIRFLGPAPIPADIYTGLGTPAFRQAQLGLSPLFSPGAAPPPAAPDDSVSAVWLCRRLGAILDALNNLPRHAERYARWRDKPSEARRPKRDDALRTGPPPYLRRKSKHEVHEILAECHWLAREALKPDTS